MAFSHIEQALFHDPAGRADRLTSLARSMKSMDTKTENHFLEMLVDAISENELLDTLFSLLLIVDKIRLRTLPPPEGTTCT